MDWVLIKFKHLVGFKYQPLVGFKYQECVLILLNAGAEVNLVGGEYDTALRAATFGEHEEITSHLIAHGADYNLGRNKVTHYERGLGRRRIR